MIKNWERGDWIRIVAAVFNPCWTDMSHLIAVCYEISIEVTFTTGNDTKMENKCSWASDCSVS